MRKALGGPLHDETPSFAQSAGSFDPFLTTNVPAEAFLAVQSEMEAERAFGLASRHIAVSSSD